ncbi:L-threonylcarbamoyladenylate synthase [Anaeromyxobacter dehalogenans]|uniref:L-threonylcarbamoyladenylate synthase n=1 Tax=Anaeromyxobacter dehalogenans (strain 2CP-C) TaxID=290397 RepID=Q2IKP2_ANADE|nr:L-threonylcarbamoyladenylate synthase [Anaeromyxobacter dehalogenans]ABC82224.1 translation factor SUA5 [Anaeromyxobacter dehalogenans 2CP-C]
MDAHLEARIAAAAAVLRAGGIVVYPTETFYGLGALASDGAALARLAAAKLRPEGKPLPLVAADREQVDRVASLEGAAARLAGRLWPGPLTLVLPARPGLSEAITAGSGTVGVRIPGSEVARALARMAGGALVSTSANLSGGPPPDRVEALDAALRAAVDHVLDAGPTPGGLPSTVVAVAGEELRVVRPGAVSIEQVTAALAGPTGALHRTGP